MSTVQNAPPTSKMIGKHVMRTLKHKILWILAKNLFAQQVCAQKDTTEDDRFTIHWGKLKESSIKKGETCIYVIKN